MFFMSVLNETTERIPVHSYELAVKITQFYKCSKPLYCSPNSNYTASMRILYRSRDYAQLFKVKIKMLSPNLKAMIYHFHSFHFSII